MYALIQGVERELSSRMFVFQRDDSPLLGGRRVTPQWGRERIYNCKLSEVIALRGGLGTFVPVIGFWLEQAVGFPASFILFQIEFKMRLGSS